MRYQTHGKWLIPVTGGDLGADAGWLTKNVVWRLLVSTYLCGNFIVGGFWEVLFATVRKHEVNEGFFVTSVLFSLILPATTPLWQVVWVSPSVSLLVRKSLVVQAVTS